MEGFIETIKVLDGRFYNLKAHERRAGATTEAFSGSLCVGGRADGCSGCDVFRVDEVSGGV
ncbi:MAG: hypothetical protein ACLUDU_14855 [Butyricimonas faecihominis]